MLLTRLLSLGISLEADANPVSSEMIVKALTVLLKETGPVAQFNLYRTQPKITAELNVALWELVQLPKTEVITEIQVINSLEQPLPFANFDEKTWALLQLLCERCISIKNICQCVHSWLAHNLENENAMQARLFLLSRQEFNFLAADRALPFIEPILASDAWPKLALLSQQRFSVEQLTEEQRAALRASMLDVITTREENRGKYAKIKGDLKSDLWAFVRYSGITSVEKKSLLDNIVALGINDILQHCIATDLTALVKIGSAVKDLTPQAVEFLANIGARLMKDCNLELNSKQLAEIASKSSATVQETVRQDKYKENAIAISQQFVDLVAVPGVLDHMVQSENALTVKEKLNQAFAHHAGFFCRVIFNTLWLVKPRVCSDVTVDWLLDLQIFRQFSVFLDPFAAGYVASMLESNDDYFIEKVFHLNNTQADKPLFKLMTQLKEYSTEGAHTSISRLLKQAEFDLMQYYAQSSETFKSLPQVNTAYQLACLFDADIANLKNIRTAAIGNFDTGIFVTELIERHGQKLHALVVFSKTTSEELKHKIIKRIFELVSLVRDQSPRDYTQLRSNLVFMQFNLKYRIERYKRDKENLTGLLKETLIKAFQYKETEAGRLRDLKIAFLEFISQYLEMNRTEKAGIQKMGGVMNAAYVFACPEKNSKKLISDIKTWLKDFILYGKNTAKTLYSLSPEMLEEIFSGVSLAESGEDLTNAQVIEKMAFGRVFTSEAERNAALDTLDHDSDAGSIPSGDETRDTISSTHSSSASAHLLANGYANGNAGGTKSTTSGLLSVLGFKGKQ